MKTILFFLLSFCLAIAWQPAQCQRVAVVGDTLTNATTGYVTTDFVLNNLVAIQATVVKVSGTVAGTAILQGTIDNLVWVDVNTDTLTLSNTTYNSKVWAISNPIYRQYRVKFTTTGGTQASIPRVAWLRRQ